MRINRTSIMTLAGMAGVATATTAAWQQSDIGQAARQLEVQRIAAKKEGLPMEWDDLRRMTPHVPTDENAATDYRIGFNLLQRTGTLKGFSTERAIVALVDGRMKPEEKTEAKAAVASMSEALDRIEGGSRHPKICFDREWEKGPALAFPEISQARNAGRSLVLRALLASDPQLAVRDLRTAARLRTHIATEPTLISNLVGVSLEGQIHCAIRYLSSRGGIWPKTLTPVLDDLGPLPDLHRLLAGEIVMGRHLGDILANGGFNSLVSGEGSVPIEMRLSGFKPVRDAFESRIIGYWRQVYRELPANPLDWKTSQKALSSVGVHRGASNALLDIALPILSGVGDLAAREETERRLTRAALDLYAHRPLEIPLDPYALKPLRFQSTPSNWQIWSVGPDEVDQGGKVKSKAAETKFDIVVTKRPTSAVVRAR